MGKISCTSASEWKQGILTTSSKRLQNNRKLGELAHLQKEEECRVEKNIRQTHFLTGFHFFHFFHLFKASS